MTRRLLGPLQGEPAALDLDEIERLVDEHESRRWIEIEPRPATIRLVPEADDEPNPWQLPILAELARNQEK